MKKMNKKGKKGFTLIELVVVIAILGILAAILIPVVGGFIDRANESANNANAKSLYNVTMMYMATTDDDLTSGTITIDEGNFKSRTDFTDLYGNNWPDVKGEGDFVVTIVGNDITVTWGTESFSGVTSGN